MGPPKCPSSMSNTESQMTEIQMTETYFETVISPCLRSFMCDNITDLNDCVDWVCNVFDINATDELIDQIADEFDAFFGN